MKAIKLLKRAAALSLASVMLINLAACKKEEVVEEPKEEVVEEEVVDNSPRSALTGLVVSEDVATNRPISVMTGDTKAALPAYGINKAGVIYEAPVEGGITRLMLIYDDYADLEQMGSVRSCRTYYAYYAAEFDSIYVHVGQAIYALAHLESGIVNNLSGLDGSIGSTFFRTSEHKAPHNTYVSGASVIEGANKKGYALKRSEDSKEHYKFVDVDSENELKDGEDAAAVSMYYFHNYPSFVYDEETKLYTRYQFGEVMTDAIDGEKTTVTNIIIQNTGWEMYEDSQYLNVYYDGSGTGKFITAGKAVDITWTKEADGITHYYYENGEEIELNRGRTWVCIGQNNYADQNVIYATIDDYNNR